MSKTDAVDLDGFLPEDQFTIEITRSVRGETRPTGWKITLANEHHDKPRVYAEERARRQLQREQAIARMIADGRQPEAEERTLESQRTDNVRYVVSHIVSWTPVRIAGETFEFSDETAFKLLSRYDMAWAYGQILDAIRDAGRFTKASVQA